MNTAGFTPSASTGRESSGLCSMIAKGNVKPTSSTRALYEQIRYGRIAPPASPRPERFSPSAELREPVRSSSPPARLVAREDELGRLGSHLEAALAGETGVVFVSGDAGSGKTALLEAFAASAMAEHPDLLVAAARCNPGGSLDALAPLRTLANMLFGDLDSDATWRPHDPDQVDRLQDASDLTLAALEQHGVGVDDTLVPAASVAARAGIAAPAAGANTRFRWNHRPYSHRPAALSQSILKSGQGNDTDTIDRRRRWYPAHWTR